MVVMEMVKKRKSEFLRPDTKEDKQVYKKK